MRDSISQFMWGYQPHFRYAFGRLAELTLSSIGVQSAPDAILVGFREEGTGAWPICIEPEGREFHPSVLTEVEERANAAFDNHPERDHIHSHPIAHERMLRRRLEDCRRGEIASALGASDAGSDRSFFVGYPRRVADFRVYPVLSVLTERWRAYPRLSRDQTDGVLVTTESLQRAVVDEVLRQVSRDLDRRSPPEELSGWPHELQNEVLRRAVGSFINSLVAVHGSWEGSEFSAALDATSAQPYEGRHAQGRVLLTRADHPDLEYALRFSEPLSVRSPRSFRKAVEMSTPDLSLVSDGSNLYGLGRLKASYDAFQESAFDITIGGRGTWELGHAGLGLLRQEDGTPRLPRERISAKHFAETAERLFGGQANVEALWNQVAAAIEQKHGTMLVVRSDADLEAERLRRQAILVAPSELDARTLAAATGIDGAVLLRPDAGCVAVGVILDGTASPSVGDSARGARFNSGVRYFSDAPSGTCLIVIVSEDGMVDLLPELKRRVRREELDVALSRFEEAAAGDDPDFEVASTRERHVEALSFYLNEAQCARYNAVKEALESKRGRAGSFIQIGWTRLQPDPEMNDSYFLDG